MTINELKTMINEANENYDLANAFLNHACNADMVETAIYSAKKASGVKYHLHCIIIGASGVPYGVSRSQIEDAYFSINKDFDFNEAYELLKYYEEN